VTAGTVNYDGQISVQAVHSGGDTGELTHVLRSSTVHVAAAVACFPSLPIGLLPLHLLALPAWRPDICPYHSLLALPFVQPWPTLCEWWRQRSRAPPPSSALPTLWR